LCYFLFFFFFFQAEDGIRDLYVTGVQTCALPILNRIAARFLNPVISRQGDRIAYDVQESRGDSIYVLDRASRETRRLCERCGIRSEERRVGKERRSRGAAEQLKKKKREERRCEV